MLGIQSLMLWFPNPEPWRSWWDWAYRAQPSPSGPAAGMNPYDSEERHVRPVIAYPDSYCKRGGGESVPGVAFANRRFRVGMQEFAAVCRNLIMPGRQAEKEIRR